MIMTTLMLLLARHDGREEIPFYQAAKEYFQMEPVALERKIKKGAIDLDLSSGTQSSGKIINVPLPELARYIQLRRAAAVVKMEEYGAG
jgi:hypothetical protein